MNPTSDRFEKALSAALAVAEIKADADNCPVRIELQVSASGTAAKKLMASTTLWPGQPSGPVIRLCAPQAVWDQVFALVPPVGHQSLGALRRQCPDFAVEADELSLAQALPFIERLLDAVRRALHGTAEPAQHPWADLRRISGSYLPLDAAGQDWVYAERAGQLDQPALLMLHTAGADARQWHGLMSQEALGRDWSLHAFDLPGHGRSPLPQGVPNWHWRLTEADYLRWVIAYMDAASIDKAVVMGCSMGSAIGLALLAKYPQRFHGALLLEAPYRAPGRRSKYLNHPQVHGARLSAAWVGSLLSPSSPQAGRDFATWIYSQGAPGVYDGDLAFYSDDFDAHHHTGAIDTARTPLWLLTGNYDYSATPADSRRVAAEVPGSHFVELGGFGHFPMVENPLGLLPLLKSPLGDLRTRIAA